MAPRTANSSLRLILIAVLISIVDFAIADYCQGYTDYTGEFITGFYCPGFHDDYQSYKCCGPSDGQYCCDYEDYSNYHGRFYWSVGKIIGVVIGGIAGLILLVIVVAVIVRCHVRKLKRKRQRQTTATVSGAHQMTRAGTTKASGQGSLHQRQGSAPPAHGQHQTRPLGMTKEQAYESLSYPPPPAYTTLPRGYAPEPQPAYPPSQGQYYRQDQDQDQHQHQLQHQLQQQQHQQPALRYTEYSQQALEEYSSPQPDYYSHKPEAANTYAPELAPPPPNETQASI